MKELLENLTELYAQRDLLTIDRKRAEEAAIPAEIKNVLADIRNEFEPKETTVSEKITELEAQIKTAVLQAGQSCKGGSLNAVFAKGRVTWDTKGLEGLMVAVPQLAQFRKVGEPSVTIRKG